MNDWYWGREYNSNSKLYAYERVALFKRDGNAYNRFRCMFCKSFLKQNSDEPCYRKSCQIQATLGDHPW